MSSTIHYHALHSSIDSSVGPHEFWVSHYRTRGYSSYRQIFGKQPLHMSTPSAECGGESSQGLKLARFGIVLSAE